MIYENEIPPSKRTSNYMRIHNVQPGINPVHDHNNQNTWGVYKKKIERDVAENPFSKYEVKKKGAKDPLSEQRDLLAKLLNRPFKQIAGLTKNWTIDELFTTRRSAEAFTKNSQALAWVLIKKLNNAKKTNNTR